MSKFLFWFFIKPLSFLPFGLLYPISNCLYFIIYYVVQYRRKVVFQNLSNAFPQKNEAEINQISKAFYQHFCDLIVETIKLFQISPEELRLRCKIKNPDLVQAYAAAGKSLIIPAGHFNNWEMAAAATSLELPHQVIAIYAPLKNRFFDEQLRQSRARFGLHLLPQKQVKVGLKKDPNRLRAILFAADQSPTSSRVAYWTTFLNQETGVMVGTEKYAKQYDYPVVFGKVKKIKRGYYEFEFIPLEEQPKNTSFGEISEKHTRTLEEAIKEQPPNWLWSHKRWKKKKPN
jgi:KDO2-lipid IV(A) lauroyltransferase